MVINKIVSFLPCTKFFLLGLFYLTLKNSFITVFNTFLFLTCSQFQINQWVLTLMLWDEGEKKIYHWSYLRIIQNPTNFKGLVYFFQESISQENSFNDLYILGEISLGPLGKAKLQILKDSLLFYHVKDLITLSWSIIFLTLFQQNSLRKIK